MTLTQLRTFLAVAETGSVRAAAGRLFVTPSAVSVSVTALQRSLGIQLVCREGRGLRLTQVGVVYADYVRRALSLLDTAGTAAAAMVHLERDALRIAALTTVGERLLPRLLADFRQRHPEVGIQLDVGNRERIRPLLDRNEVDLVLGGRPLPGSDHAVLGVRPHELIVVASEPPFTGPDARGVLNWVDRQTWLLREQGSGTRDATMELLARLDLAHPPRAVTVGSNAAVREAVVAGLGVTLISRDAVVRELADGRLFEIRLPGTPLPRAWHLTAGTGPIPAAVLTFVTHLITTGEFRPRIRTRR